MSNPFYTDIHTETVHFVHRLKDVCFLFSLSLLLLLLFVVRCRFDNVEAALTNNSFTEVEHLDEITKDFGEVACFALQLIGKLCARTERHELAAEANKRALKLNPFLWCPFADLCNQGQKPDPNAIFQIQNGETFATCQSSYNTNSVWWAVGTHANVSVVSTDNNPTENVSDSVLNTNSNIYNIYTTPVTAAPPPCNLTAINVSNPSPTILPRSGIDETPIMNSGPTVQHTGDDVCGTTPYRRQFRFLSNISPSTPSFGWLPLNSPTETNLGVNNRNSSPTAQPTYQLPTLVEANEQKTVNKKLKGNVGSLINRKETPLQLSKPTQIFNQAGNITPRAQNTLGGQNVRRSSRLFSSNNYSVKENNKSPIITKFIPPRSPPRKTKQRNITKMNLANTALNEINNEKQQKSIVDKEKIETITSATTDAKITAIQDGNSVQNMAQHIMQLKKQSAEGLLSLMRVLGEGYLHLSQYNCKCAIECFSSIQKHHYASSWVQSMVGKALYEQREYEASAKIFQEVHSREPYRLHLMEIYSSVLWHLQREVMLSALAQDLMAQDKLSPITWCISGNCFSLHKEHETAIKFFERAVQVDPEFAYSYTLLGHELVITEELEKAMSCFRTAILKDSRHYNAWYGIGSIYSKQERYSLAEFHFKHALKINPQSSVLMVHIGAMQFNLSKTEQALQTMNAAIQLDPKNPLCKFHRGSMYFQCGKHQEALKELEQLKQIVPKESLVYYYIGKIHKKLGNVDLALMNFSWATDLDPKGANNQVKDAFDSNTNQTSIGSNVTHDAESSDESTQLRSGDHDAELDVEPEGYESDTL